MLKKLSARARKRDKGKVAIALTANRHYSLKGVKPGARFSLVSKRLHAGKKFRLGPNSWYLTAGANRGVVKVRHGVIQEVGVVDRSLTSHRASASRLLREF